VRGLPIGASLRLTVIPANRVFPCSEDPDLALKDLRFLRFFMLDRPEYVHTGSICPATVGWVFQVRLMEAVCYAAYVQAGDASRWRNAYV
jgi:hypothetical protein